MRAAADSQIGFGLGHSQVFEKYIGEQFVVMLASMHYPMAYIGGLHEGPVNWRHLYEIRARAHD